MNRQESPTTAVTGSEQALAADPSLWFEALMTGLEALLQEELVRRDDSGRAATDIQRARLLTAYLYEASRLALDCLRTGLKPVPLNAGFGLRSTLPGSAPDQIGAAKDGNAMKSQDPLWRLTAEAVMKGAHALLEEEIARKDSGGHPATDSPRARALLVLSNRISAATIHRLVRDVRTLIDDFEQPSLF